MHLRQCTCSSDCTWPHNCISNRRNTSIVITTRLHDHTSHFDRGSGCFREMISASKPGHYRWMLVRSGNLKKPSKQLFCALFTQLIGIKASLS